MQKLWARITGFRRDEQGASLVEYALLIALIAIIALASVAYFGVELADEYASAAASLA